MKKAASRTGNAGGKTSDEDHNSKLQKLFTDELKDIYWAEKALVKAIPKMIKKATSEELIQALESHLAETEEHVSRVEEVFAELGMEPRTKKCEAMEGLIAEAESVMKDADDGVMLDAAIIASAQKVEHYEIASYGTLRTFAQTLGLKEAVQLLEQTLTEEKAADEKLTEVAESSINMQAANEEQ
ncbi:MAG: ferritin-like domain-containing protein [Cyclobacteriaceae bacterium]|jgi:ferritin-like metal-binding protein YciE|nr:ferritin-like domain-containing protein [Cyclobacteriaceae bacterium]